MEGMLGKAATGQQHLQTLGNITSKEGLSKTCHLAED